MFEKRQISEAQVICFEKSMQALQLRKDFNLNRLFIEFDCSPLTVAQLQLTAAT